MTDSSTVAAQAAETGETAETDSPADAGAESQAQAEEILSLAEARKLRREHQTLRKRNAELEAETAQHRLAGLSELEQAKQRITELEAAEAQAATERKAQAVERLLAGAQYPDLLVRQLDLATIEMDTDGGIRQGEKLVNRLRRDYPLLWSSGSADGGAQGAATTGFDMNAYIRRRVGRP